MPVGLIICPPSLWGDAVQIYKLTKCSVKLGEVKLEICKETLSEIWALPHLQGAAPLEYICWVSIVGVPNNIDNTVVAQAT